MDNQTPNPLEPKEQGGKLESLINTEKLKKDLSERYVLYYYRFYIIPLNSFHSFGRMESYGRNLSTKLFLFGE
jgi:hypothetical protein